MTSPYPRIALNYVRPLGFKIAYACIAVWWGLMLWYRLASRDPLPDTMPAFADFFFAFLPAIWLGAMAVTYAKEQIATWQASLVPGYRRPHLIVAALYLVVALVGVGLLFNLIVKLAPFGAISLCVFAAGIIGWLIFDPSIKTIIAIFAMFGLLSFPRVQVRIEHVLRGDANALAGALAIVGLGLFGWIGFQLSRLREEMPQYRTSRPGMMRAQIPSMFGEGVLDAIASRMARWPSWRIALRHPLPMDSLLARSSHRRVISSAGWVPWRVGVGWTLLLFIMMLAINLAFDPRNRMTMDVIGPIVFIVSMPAAPIMISLLWMRRAGMYGYELSLPSSRQAFVLENLIALARDYFSLWLATLVLSIAIVMLATPTSLRPDWSGLVDGIAFFGAGQFAAFAIIAWTLRFRSTLLSIFTMVIAAILSIPPLLLTMQHGIEERAMWMTVAILLALGTIVIIDAYRGWVRTSFD